MYFEDIENPTEEQKNAAKQIDGLCEQAQLALRSAAELGQEHGISFSQRLDGYGHFDPEDGGWQSSDVCY